MTQMANESSCHGWQTFLCWKELRSSQKLYEDMAVSCSASSVNHFISVSLFSRLHKTNKKLMNWKADRLKEIVKGNSELIKKPGGKCFVNISKIILCLNAD